MGEVCIGYGGVLYWSWRGRNWECVVYEVECEIDCGVVWGIAVVFMCGE